MSPHRPVEGRGRLAAALGVALILAILCAVCRDPRPPTPPPAPAHATARVPADDPPTTPVREPEPPSPAPADDPHAASAAWCRVTPPIPEGEGVLLVGDGREPPYDARPVSITDGRFRMPMVAGLGSGVLAIEGYAPTPILWSSTAESPVPLCAPDPIPLEVGEAWITGAATTRGGHPVAGAMVEGCGARVTTDGDGAYAMSVRTGGACTVAAYRRDGWLVARADSADVTPAPGQDIVVDFTFPDEPRGGLGISVVPDPRGGLVVGMVLAGSAAAEYGLAPGDHVVSIDGVAATELTPVQFAELATGDPGTPVTLTVVRPDPDGEDRTVDLVIPRKPVLSTHVTSVGEDR